MTLSICPISFYNEPFKKKFYFFEKAIDKSEIMSIISNVVA